MQNGFHQQDEETPTKQNKSCWRLNKKVNFNKDATLPINEKMTDMMYKSFLWQSAPDIGIDLFRCKPVEFSYFMSLFEEVAESKTEDRKGRLARFIKFTRRETKELVKHCIQQPKELCYENLKALMKKRYGNSHLYTRN